MSKKASSAVAIRGDVVVGPGGKPRGVFLSMAEYKKVQALLEDVIDVDWMESHRSEADETVAWVDVKQNLKEEGLV
jgi:hypothetical protein